MFKKLLALTMSAIMVVGMSTTAFAAEISPVGSTLTETPSLTQGQKDTLNDWVAYDESNRQFLIKDGAQTSLDENDYALLNSCIATTNSNLNKADFSSGEVFVVAPENEGYSISLYFSEGVTRIEFHWWGATIYLSKSTIIGVGAGVAIGGIWIPEPVVSKILATLGVLIALCPGGIAFDYNYIAAGIGSLVPGMNILFPAVSNMRWQ